MRSGATTIVLTALTFVALLSPGLDAVAGVKQRDTIKSLENKQVEIRPGKVILRSSDLARDSYRAFLDLVSDDPLLRAEAMRRLGDLELEATEAQQLVENVDALEQADLESLKVRERVSLAVQTRLGLMLPHREAIRRGLSFLALPQNAALGTQLLWRTADAIWWAAGDSATDHNYYSKRTLLVGVYSSTLLVWLDDQSEEQSDSKAFLERRIDGALKIGFRFGTSINRLLNLPDQLCGSLGRRRPLRRRSV